MKPVAYQRLAASELVKSAEFYESRIPGLGTSFLSVIEAALAEIRHQPQLGKPGKHDTRSWKIRRFPFRIVYLEQPERFWIVAIMHLSRAPDYWIRRLRD